MEARFVNPFLIALQDVLKTAAQAEVEIKKPKKKGSEQCEASGTIAFSGDQTGVFGLGFPKEVACGVVGNMLGGMDFDMDDPMFADAFKEIVGMVSGRAKPEFAGVSIQIEQPEVTVGEPHSIEAEGFPADQPRLLVPCTCELGDFWGEIGMQ